MAYSEEVIQQIAEEIILAELHAMLNAQMRKWDLYIPLRRFAHERNFQISFSILHHATLALGGRKKLRLITVKEDDIFLYISKEQEDIDYYYARDCR